MKLLIETFANTGALHHAYVLEGERESVREELFNFVEKTLKHPIQANPDFWHEQFETFTIDDARKLKEMQSLKSIAYPRKIFTLETLGMTVEAQNALLKIFEEPTPGTHFFIITSSADILLPTLRSRVVVISSEARSEKGKTRARNFLAASAGERIGLVSDIIENKDKLAAIELVDALIRECAGKKTEKNPSVMHELLAVRGYLSDRAPSLKLILEHLAITL